jgi:hypothetical protein
LDSVEVPKNLTQRAKRNETISPQIEPRQTIFFLGARYIILLMKIWTAQQDQYLKDLVERYGEDWETVTALFNERYLPRSESLIQSRWQKQLDPSLVKGLFSQDEDDKILAYVEQNGPTSWHDVAKLLPGRNAKQCRERWFNHLDPNIDKGPWTPADDMTILEWVLRIGTKWSTIAKMIPRRTDNSIKNRWNSALAKSMTSRNIAGPGRQPFRRPGSRPKSQKAVSCKPVFATANVASQGSHQASGKSPFPDLFEEDDPDLELIFAIDPSDCSPPMWPFHFGPESSPDWFLSD